MVNVGIILTEHHAIIKAVHSHIWTPLHSACKWNRVDFAVLLATNGADIEALDQVEIIKSCYGLTSYLQYYVLEQ